MNYCLSERIVKFQKNSLGLKRGEVHLAAFNTKWKRSFSDEAILIFNVLKDESLRLYHIGSTSVPGLDAKPIIDILGSVESIQNLDFKKNLLESIGYEYKGEYGIKGRRYCVLYNPEKTMAYVHLHIFEHGDSEVSKHLNFRDQLRHSSVDRDAYAHHKKFLINDVNTSRAHYSDAKGEIIKKIQEMANSQSAIQTVFAILGTAEGHSNTEEFLKNTYSDKKLEIVDLSNTIISPYKYTKKPNDKFLEIIKDAIKSDLIVLATPVYWYSMSGSMKNFIDRFSDLLSPDHKNLGEALYGNKMKILCTGSDVGIPFGFEASISATAIYFGIDYLGADYKSIC